jgi:hypothetical protein
MESISVAEICGFRGVMLPRGRELICIISGARFFPSEVNRDQDRTGTFEFARHVADIVEPPPLTHNDHHQSCSLSSGGRTRHRQ